MHWSDVQRNGITLRHLQQDDNSNQCVAASIGMISENAKYWFKNDSALISYGASAMKKNNPGQFGGLNDRAIVNVHGIRPNSILSFMQSYGWTVDALSAANAQTLIQRVNNMANFDACILACGVDSFHALAVIRLKNNTYVLNPAYGPQNPDDQALSYSGINAVLELAGPGRIQFRQDQNGNSYHRTVDTCHFIAAQSNLGTLWRWMTH